MAPRQRVAFARGTFPWVSAAIHVKSHYSFGVGTACVEALVQRARAGGHAALALTDLESLQGQIELHQRCRTAGLRAITGVELREGFGPGRPGTKRGRLLLVARNHRGYAALCRVLARRHSGRGPLPPPVASLHETPADDLFVLTDDAVALRTAAAIWGPAPVRALLVRPDTGCEEVLRAQARRSGVRCVASTETLFLEAGDWTLHRLSAAAHRGCTLATLEKVEAPSRHLHSTAELARLFDDVPEALSELDALTGACELDLLALPAIVPGVPGVEASEAHAALAQRCHEGLRRDQDATPGSTYARRLSHELQVIEALDLSRYFLAVSDILQLARRSRIPMAGRGSAVGSLVAHLLGVSPVDPVAHGLYFERFIRRGRQPPDVDLDVASARRDELIDRVRKHFGPDRVARVSAVHRFQRRAAYREGLKALGADPHVVASFARQLPSDELLDAGRADIPSHLLPAAQRRHVPLVERLIDMPRHVALHPGGVVLADRDLADHLPLEPARGGGWMTQYDADALAHAGVSKLDLLGNHALDEIAEAHHWLGGIVEPLPLDDADTLATIDGADTLGCFQIESPAMRSVLRRLPVRSLDDVVAALAIVRPGPASSRAKSAFLQRARGEAPPVFLHPRLRPRLQATHGIFLYEEDIDYVLATLAGMDIEAAESVRSAIQHHRDDAAWQQRAYRRLSRRATARGFDEPTIRRAWKEILDFASYAFNKAHAASYALLAYQAAYLKTHAPVELGCALLNHHGGVYPKRALASDLQRHGVQLLPPSVQRSRGPCSVEGNAPRAVRIGLSGIRGLRKATLQRLLRERDERAPFTDLQDFLRRVRPAGRELEGLLLSGSCDGLAPLSTAVYPWLHQAIQQAARRDPAPDVRCIARDLEAPRLAGSMRDRHTFRALTRVFNELVYLELALSDHPMRILRDEARRQGCVTTRELPERAGLAVRFAGVAIATRRVPVRGGVMQFMTLEDEHGSVETRLRPAAFEQLGSTISTPGPFLVEGTVVAEQGDTHLVVRSLLPFHRRPRPYAADV